MGCPRLSPPRGAGFDTKVLRIGTGHHAGPRYTDADTRTEWLNEYMYQLNVNNCTKQP